MLYNDTVFGGISWSKDGNKIVFIGEQPEIATYKPFFKDAEEEKKTEEKKDSDEDVKKKEEEKKEEHW